MELVLLDTDILSEVIKQRNANVVSKAATYLHVHGQFVFSAFTRFEIERGYKDKNATTLLSRFRIFCQNSFILPVDDRVFDRATDLWVFARQGGHPLADADLLIAATALEHGRLLATGNSRHFSWIPGLRLTDWRTA